jgi:hypothetical protein
MFGSSIWFSPGDAFYEVTVDLMIYDERSCLDLARRLGWRSCYHDTHDFNRLKLMYSISITIVIKSPPRLI